MILRVAAGAFALLFALAAGLQFNDPDPLVWSLLYAAVAVASVRVAAGGRPGIATFGLLSVLAGAFAFWAPALWHLSGEALQSFGMSGAPEEEEVREAAGLGLALAWTLLLWLASGRRLPWR